MHGKRKFFRIPGSCKEEALLNESRASRIDYPFQSRGQLKKNNKHEENKSDRNILATVLAVLSKKCCCCCTCFIEVVLLVYTWRYGDHVIVVKNKSISLLWELNSIFM